MIKTIIACTRHDLTESQVEGLEKAYGSVRIVKFDQTIADTTELVELAKAEDAIAIFAVLPPGLMGELRASWNHDILRSISVRERVSHGNEEPKFEFIHKEWVRITACVYKEETLSS